jgi:chemotaxis protein MotB
MRRIQHSLNPVSQRRIIVSRLYLPILVMALLLSAGCVSKSTYQQKVDESAALQQDLDALQQNFADLQNRYAQLTESNQALQADFADATTTIAGLQQDLERSGADIKRLEQVLSTRSAEAGAAMTEMRQTIERLDLANRELTNQVEMERIAREARLAQMKNTYDQLVGKLETEIQRGEVTISELQGKLTVNMVERILFDSGKAEIKPAGLDVLRRVGNILNEAQDKVVQVEGHTDSIPISGRLKERFPSNWELSTARAANVVHFLQEQVGIPGERLAVTGYGPYRPIADNDSPDGREQNRRIQIVLVPAEAKIVKAVD